MDLPIPEWHRKLGEISGLIANLQKCFEESKGKPAWYTRDIAKHALELLKESNKTGLEIICAVENPKMGGGKSE